MTVHLLYCREASKPRNNLLTSPPQSFGKSASLISSENSFSPALHVLAVVCTMRNEAFTYGMLLEHCASLTDVTEHYGALRDFTEALRIVTERYRALTVLRNLTENIDFARH